jgi:hypothetical protein
MVQVHQKDAVCAELISANAALGQLSKTKRVRPLILLIKQQIADKNRKD